MSALRLLASGRDADVFELDSHRVLRRYRNPSWDVAVEATAMRLVRTKGYPAPEVHDADGPDLVLERLGGRSMLAELARRPRYFGHYLDILVELHEQLHALVAPPWLPVPLEPGRSILHLDLHPGNVLLTADGPMVIDWSNVAAGPAAADLAQTWIVVATGPVPDGVPPEVVARSRGAFLRAFASRTDVDETVRLLPSVAAWRAVNPDLGVEERRALDRLVRHPLAAV